jgi:hypothetical protein
MKYLLPAIFILYVFFLSVFSNAEFPSMKQETSFLPYLADRPLTEDGFYSLKIAWNIGTGKGVTHNFNKQTTGFQPLYVFILSILANITSNFGGDKITFLRLVIILSGFIALLLTFLFYRFIFIIEKQLDRKFLFLITGLLILFNFKLFLNLFNGLETGLYLIFLLLSVNQTQLLIEGNKNLKRILLYGFILGLTVLTRNDFVLIALVIIILLIHSKTIRIKDSFIILLILFLTVLPWIVFIYSVQGSVIPTSASVQTGLTANDLYYRIDQFFFSLFSNYIPFIHSGQTQSKVIYVLAVTFILYLIRYQRQFIKSFVELQVIKFWFVAFMIISIVYLFFASQPFFFFRYLSIHLVIAIPFLAILIAKELLNRSIIFKNIFFLTVILIFCFNVGYYFHYPKKASDLALRPAIINQNKFYKEKIGMAQSGISGYFFVNIINLDGKVNVAALSAIKKNELYEYILNENISILIEWEEWLDLLPAQKLNKDWNLSKSQIKDNKTLVLIRKKSTDLLSP